MKTIDLEAHFYTRAVFDYLTKRKEFPLLIKGRDANSFSLRFTEEISLFQTSEFINTLCDLGQNRIDEMDKAGLDVQVLSFSSPGIDEFYPDSSVAQSLSVELNDLLFETIKKYPARFMGFAAISPYETAAAINELERAIKQLGFVGWLAHSNFGAGNYLDNKEYWPLLEAAEDLKIPIYLHPTTPLMKQFGTYGFALGGPPLGFQFDASLCLLRMIYAGVFDQFPKLTVILGHMGETLPFLMPERIDWAYKNPNIAQLKGFIEQRPDIKRTPCEVLLSNIYVTTSGRFSEPLLEYTLKVMGEDKVMLATDYPYENLKQSMDFIRHCDLSEKILQNICSLNAERLGIK